MSMLKITTCMPVCTVHIDICIHTYICTHEASHTTCINLTIRAKLEVHVVCEVMLCTVCIMYHLLTINVFIHIFFLIFFIIYKLLLLLL